MGKAAVRFSILLLFFLGSGIAGLSETPLQQAAAGERQFLQGLKNVDKLMEDGEYQAAFDRIRRLLVEHEGREYVVLRRTRIVESIKRCRIRIAVPLPPVRKLLSGRLRTYNPRTGQLNMSYSPDQLADFERPASGVLVHPAAFVGPHRITVTGRKYQVNEIQQGVFQVLTFLACWHQDEGYRVYVGNKGYKKTILEYSTPAKIEKIIDNRNLDCTSATPSPAAVGKKYKLTLHVTDRLISLSYKGKTVVKTEKPKNVWGRFGLAFLPEFDRIEIQGKVDPSWIQELRDNAPHDAEQEFLKSFDVNADIPEWLKSNRNAEVRSEPKARELPWLMTPPQLENFNKAKRLIESGDHRAAADFLNKLKADGLPPDMRVYLFVQLLARAGRLHEAFDLVEGLCQRNPGNPVLRTDRAMLLLDVGSLQESIDEFRELIASEPDYPDLYGGLCSAHLLAGDLESAREVILSARRAAVDHEQIDYFEAIMTKAEQGPSWEKSERYESDHYIVVSDLNRKTCVDTARNLEAFYELVSGLFGQKEFSGKKNIVYVFSSETRFKKYIHEFTDITLHNTVGIYNKFVKQLVILDSADQEDTPRVTRHEGLHQYFDSIGAKGPTWFEEGLAEYCSNVITDRSGRMDSLGAVNFTHARFLRKRLNALIPTESFIRLHGNAFYQDFDILYPQAWSFVHFLRNESDETRSIYKRLLDGCIAAVGPKLCVDLAFSGVDLTELHQDYVEYLRRM